VALRIDDGQRHRQGRVGLVMSVMIRSMPSSRARRAASTPRMPQSTEITSRTPSASGDRTFGLKAVAVAHPLRDEVAHVGAQQLERAAQNHGGGDAVDVVIAVDGDSFPARDRREHAIHGRRHIGQRERIVQMSSDGWRNRCAIAGSSIPRIASSRAIAG